MKPETKNDAAHIIKRLRTDHGLTVEQIATKTKISFATLYRYMRKEKPLRMYHEALIQLEKEVRQNANN